MTIDTSVPVGTELISNLDNRDREERLEINSLWAAVAALGWTSGLVVSSIRSKEMSAGQTDLVVGTDVEDLPLELVMLTGAAAVDLENITGARSGSMKIFRFGDGNVTVKYDASKIVLNGSQDLEASLGDILWLFNSGGDPDAGTDGVWYELMRYLNVT